MAASPEPILAPGQIIIDPHHHLYDRPGLRYLADEFRADLQTGHDIRATVFVQARAMYRQTGPDELRPVGETEYARSVADEAGPRRICDGIVGFADLLLGDRVRPVLEAHMQAGGDAFRGIRHTLAWDPDPALLNAAYPTAEDLMQSPPFRAGFALLQELGLSFDAWLYFPQIPRLTNLARAFPGVPIVLDHCGGILGTGRYSGRHDEAFATWKPALRDLAACPNVMVKLGGLGMPLCGFGFDASPEPASSTALADAWRPWIETCIELFGTGRCMFESNFPADRPGHGYAVGWNAMKRLAAAASAEEKDDLFWRSAARFYRLAPP